MVCMQAAVEARSLEKKYGNKTVVNKIDLFVPRGECFGILGPNGAGKTSTLRMLYGMNRITSGELFVLGLNVRTHLKVIKSKIGIVPQMDGLDHDFTVMDNLLVFARFVGLKQKQARLRALELLRLMQLEEYKDHSVEVLSGGMKRRLVIARALLNEPELLILDEPTTGLDPQARQWIWHSLEQLKRAGRSLILTTHYMEEAEVLCDRLVIMDRGQILCEGHPKDLIEEHIGREVVEFEVAPEDLNYFVKKVRDQYRYQVINRKIQLFIGEDQDGREAAQLVNTSSIRIRRAALNDVFLKLSGHELRDQ